MKIFGIDFGKRKKEERGVMISTLTDHNSHLVNLLESRSKPMLLSTVYRCVDLISDSVGVLPLETYLLDSLGYKRPHFNHPIYDILNLEPNENMTRFTFFKTLMTSVLLRGNGYAYIERDNSNRVVQLEYLPSENVSMEWVTIDGKSRKRYRVIGKESLVEPRDIFHVLNFSYDGHTGVSTLTHARETLGLASDSESHAAGYFKGGGSMAGVLTVEGARLTTDQKDDIYKTWGNRTNPVTGSPNGIVVLEQNMKYQPISVSPKDAQLLESRQFNVLDICRFFSVSPVKAFDLSRSSYSTVEAEQLGYLADTVLSIITKIELEINRKIFLPSERKVMKAEFNTAAILRTDKAAQGEYWNKMFQVGAATPNEIRREMNLPKMENGDQAFVQVNVQTLDNAVKDRVIDEPTTKQE